MALLSNLRSLLLLLLAYLVTRKASRVPQDQPPLWTVSWNAPFLSSPSGYGSEATYFLKGLFEITRGKNWKLAAGLVHGDAANQEYLRSMDETQLDFLRELDSNQRTLDPRKSIVVCHSEPGAWSVPKPLYQSPQPCPPIPGQRYFRIIGRTMFETDRLPKDWHLRLNQMDEVWAPTTFMKNIMEEGGVTKPIEVVGQGIDVEQRWNPAHHSNFSTTEWEELFRHSPTGCKPGDFKFLSVFKWERRKAPDVLLKVFWDAFDSVDGVCLVLVTSAYNDDPSTIPAHLQQHWDSFKPKGSSNDPSSITILSNLDGEALTRLYANVQAFVLPSRGEGWGRPYMEAMAMGLPVIATNWSGPTEFITPSNGYLLPIHQDLVDAALEAFPGHKWAEPIAEELVGLLRSIFWDYDRAKGVGQRAREHIVENWSHVAVARQVLGQLRRLVGHTTRETERGNGNEL